MAPSASSISSSKRTAAPHPGNEMYKSLKSRIKNSVTYVTFKEWKKAYFRKRELSRYLGTACRCPVCGTRLREFKPMWKSFFRKAQEVGYVYPLSSIETFNIAAYTCPACDASDRERLYALYLDQAFAALDKQRRYRFVEFAPSIALRKKLEQCDFLEYRSADLVRRTVDDRLDITDMRAYPDCSVDMFLCSHILEHVPDDRKALSELHRILKPLGFGIVMVPLVHGVDETHEDPAIDTPDLRWKHYGQDDHLRQYGKRDFLKRLEQAGFRVDRYCVDYFGDESFKLAGIAPDSVLYVARKAAAFQALDG